MQKLRPECSWRFIQIVTHHFRRDKMGTIEIAQMFLEPESLIYNALSQRPRREQ